MERTATDTPTEEAWAGFTSGIWNEAIDVRDFIQDRKSVV